MIRYVLFAGLVLAIGFVCFDLGQRGARAYERMQVVRISNGLDALGITWAQIEADGLQLELHGHAPDLFARELALESAQATAPMARIVNFATATLAPPERREPVRVELHRDARGITMTGQTSSREMRAALGKALGRDNPELTIHDLTGIQAAHPPRGWGREIQVSSLAASRMPNAYVVMRPGQVVIEGEVSDDTLRDELTRELLARAGDKVSLVLNIQIPARVIAPFAFSAQKDAGAGIRLERCAARSIAEQARLRQALSAAGAEKHANSCPIGLGSPSGAWDEAVIAAVDALAELPAGRVDLEYHSARLIAYPPTSPHVFQDIVERFLSDLPEGFDGTGESRSDDIATRIGIGRERYWMHVTRRDGLLTLSGQVPGETSRLVIDTYAAALFGAQNIRTKLARPRSVDWGHRSNHP